MNNRQVRVLESYRRAINALDDARETHPRELLMLMERLRSCIADIDRCDTQQYLAIRDPAVSRLRDRLDHMRTEQMLPLARLGLRLLAGDAGMRSALRVPHKRAPSEEILAAADRMVKAMEPHRALLKSAKTSPERIAQLKREARFLRKEFKATYAGIADRAVPTRRLAELMRTARLDFRAIDALVGAHGSALLREKWRKAIRVQERIGRPRKRKTAAVVD